VLRLKNLSTSCAVVTKSGNINFLEHSGPHQACNGTDFLYYFQYNSTIAAHSTSCTCCPLTEGQVVEDWEISIIFRKSGTVVKESIVNFVAGFFNGMCIFRALRWLILFYIYIYMYIYVFVCVCVCVYENITKFNFCL
jgi:hypothetical protein